MFLNYRNFIFVGTGYFIYTFKSLYSHFKKFYSYGKNSPFLGIFLGVCSCLCIAFASLFISRIKSISPLQVTNVRMITQLLLSLPPLIYFSNELVPTKNKMQRKLLLPLYIRCVAGTIGVTCLTFSLVYAPIADSSAICFTSPVYVAILARVFLKEKVNLADCGLLFLALFGVFFVTRPPFIFNFISNKLSEHDIGGHDPGDTHFIHSSYMYYDHDKMHDLNKLATTEYDKERSQALFLHYKLFHNNSNWNSSNLSYNFLTNNSTLPIMGKDLIDHQNRDLYPHRVLGLCFAVISSILTAIAMVTIRKINKLPFSTVLVNFSAVGTIGTAVLCAALKHYSLPDCLWVTESVFMINTPTTFLSPSNQTYTTHMGPNIDKYSITPAPSPSNYHFQRPNMERIYILGASLLGTMGQLFLFLSLRFENAGVIAAVNSSTIVFTILLQILFQRKIPPWTSFVGSAIIIVAICLFGYRKWKVERAKRLAKLKRYSSAKRASTQMHHSATMPTFYDTDGNVVFASVDHYKSPADEEFTTGKQSTPNLPEQGAPPWTLKDHFAMMGDDEGATTSLKRSESLEDLAPKEVSSFSTGHHWMLHRFPSISSEPPELNTIAAANFEGRGKGKLLQPERKMFDRYIPQTPMIEEEQLNINGGGSNYNTIFSATDDTVLLPTHLRPKKRTRPDELSLSASSSTPSSEGLSRGDEPFSLIPTTPGGGITGGEFYEQAPGVKINKTTIPTSAASGSRRGQRQKRNSARSPSRKSSTTFSFFRQSSLNLSSLFGGGGGLIGDSIRDSLGALGLNVKMNRKNSASISSTKTDHRSLPKVSASGLAQFDTNLLNIPEPPDENQLTTNTVIVPQW